MASKEILYKIGLDGVPQVVSGADAAGRALGKLGTGSANAGVALQNLNFVIRDSPYFFKDFQLGVLAVGNNMNPLIDSMVRLRIEAAAAGTTFSKVLWSSLKGPAGIMVAMSAFITILQAVTFQMGKTKSASKEAAKDIDALRDSIDDLSNSFGEAMKKQEEYNKEIGKSAVEAEIAQLEAFKKRGFMWAAPFGGDPKEAPRKIMWTSENDKQLNELKDKLKDIAKPLQDFITKIQQLTDAGSLNVNAIKKLKMAYGDIIASVTHFSKLQKTFDAEDPIFAYYDKIIKTLKQYQDLVEKGAGLRRTSILDPSKSQYLGLMPIDGAEVNEEEFKRRQKRLEDLRWRLGFTPEEKQYDLKHPLQEFWSKGKETKTLLGELTDVAKNFGNTLSSAFLEAADAAQVLKSILSQIIGVLINYAVSSVLPVPGVGNLVNSPAGGTEGGGLFKNIYSQGTKGGSAPAEIVIRGSIEARQEKFVMDFEKAKYRMASLKTGLG